MQLLEPQVSAVHAFRDHLVSALDQEWDRLRSREPDPEDPEEEALQALNDEGAAYAHVITELNRMSLSSFRTVGRFRRAVLELVEFHGKFRRQADGTYRMPDGMAFEPAREDWENSVEFWLPGYLAVYQRIKNTFAVVSGGNGSH